MPHAGANAVGAEVGAFIPNQDGMSHSAEVTGFFEPYLTARDSLRLAVGWADPKVETSNDQSTRQVRIGGEVIHNWEGGSVHPFVGAGLSAYFLKALAAGTDGDTATRLGGTILGGAEFFASKTFSVKGEARYNVVSKWNGYDPSGLSLTIGVKSYF
jgi:opacity family porin